MAVTSPVSPRSTVVALLLLTFATGLADSISILALGHVFVANMTGNVIFLGFWLAPRTSIDLTAVVVALPTFVCTTVLSGRLSRHFGERTRAWITTVLATETALLVALSLLAGAGVLRYQEDSKLIMIGILAVTFGLQHSSARAAAAKSVYLRLVTNFRVDCSGPVRRFGPSPIWSRGVSLGVQHGIRIARARGARPLGSGHGLQGASVSGAAANRRGLPDVGRKRVADGSSAAQPQTPTNRMAQAHR